MTRYALAFTFILLLIAVKGYGQQFYTSTADGFLERVTITSQGPVSQSVTGCGEGFYSIALSGNKLYYNTFEGTLYSADITGGQNPTISNCTELARGIIGNSLGIDDKGVLYYADKNMLYSIDPNTFVRNTIGMLPYTASGDLLFFNNQLYLGANEGIVKVNLQNPAQSQLVIPLGEATLGLVAIAANGGVKIYALSDDEPTQLIELDLQNNKQAGNAGTLNFIAYDGASYIPPVIPVIVVDYIDVEPECNIFNKGHVEIICDSHTATYLFTLSNGQKNNTGVFDNLDPGDYQVAITANGEATKVVNFTVDDYSKTAPAIKFTATNPICNIKGQIKLDAGADDQSYKIKFKNVLYGFDHIFAGLDAGTYHFTIYDPKGCIANEQDYTLAQDVCPPIQITDIKIQPECDAYGQAGVTVTTAAHSDVYTYTLNGVTNSTGIFDFLPEGTYTLTITSSGGDKVEKQVVISDDNFVKPQVTYTAKNVVCSLAGSVNFVINNKDGGFQVKSDGKLFNSGETIKGLTPGTHHFDIFNEQGCIVDMLDIDIGQDKCVEVVFPNAFTPNGDGINDIFRPNQDSNPANFCMFIFDRWGQQVFQTKDALTGWDGKCNNRPAPVGIYYWMATFLKPDGQNTTQSGFVTLIR